MLSGTDEDRRGVVEWALTLARDTLREERNHEDHKPEDSFDGSNPRNSLRLGLSANLNGSHVNCDGQQASLGCPNTKLSASQGGTGLPVSSNGSESNGSVEPAATHEEDTTNGNEDEIEDDYETHEPINKRQKITADSPDTVFDPSALITAKEGTFFAHPVVVKYLDKRMKKYLDKDDGKTLKKEHPQGPCCR